MTTFLLCPTLVHLVQIHGSLLHSKVPFSVKTARRPQQHIPPPEFLL